MKTRKIFFFIFLLITFTGIAVLSGCSHASDACSSEYCLNGASCSNGRCNCGPNFAGEHCDSCKAGYEGSDCSALARAKFLYSGYSVSETDNHGGSGTYSSTILASTTQVDQVYLTHVAGNNFSNSVAAVCKGTTITIPLQSPDHNQGFIRGTGSVSSGIIAITCQIGDSATTSLATFSSTWRR